MVCLPGWQLLLTSQGQSHSLPPIGGRTDVASRHHPQPLYNWLGILAWCCLHCDPSKMGGRSIWIALTTSTSRSRWVQHNQNHHQTPLDQTLKILSWVRSRVGRSTLPPDPPSSPDSRTPFRQADTTFGPNHFSPAHFSTFGPDHFCPRPLLARFWTLPLPPSPPPNGSQR